MQDKSFTPEQVDRLLADATSRAFTVSEKAEALMMLRAYARLLHEEDHTTMTDLLARMIRAERERDDLKRKIQGAPRGVVRMPGGFGSGGRGSVARIECNETMIGWTVAMVRIER
jgi:hypothetical protein